MSHSPGSNPITVVRMRLIEIVTKAETDYVRVASCDENGESMLVPADSVVAIEPRGSKARSGDEHDGMGSLQAQDGQPADSLSRFDAQVAQARDPQESVVTHGLSRRHDDQSL
jgi:hypothetical protein